MSGKPNGLHSSASNGLGAGPVCRGGTWRISWWPKGRNSHLSSLRPSRGTLLLGDTAWILSLSLCFSWDPVPAFLSVIPALFPESPGCHPLEHCRVNTPILKVGRRVCADTTPRGPGLLLREKEDKKPASKENSGYEGQTGKTNKNTKAWPFQIEVAHIKLFFFYNVLLAPGPADAGQRESGLVQEALGTECTAHAQS